MTDKIDALKDQFNQLYAEVTPERRETFMAYIQERFLAIPDSEEHQHTKALVDDCLQYTHARQNLTLLETLLIAHVLNGGLLLQDVTQGMPVAQAETAEGDDAQEGYDTPSDDYHTGYHTPDTEERPLTPPALVPPPDLDVGALDINDDAHDGIAELEWGPRQAIQESPQEGPEAIAEAVAPTQPVAGPVPQPTKSPASEMDEFIRELGDSML
eukprot:26974-Rhodomonas_salina.5